MGPVDTSYIIRSQVLGLQEQKISQWKSGIGPDAIFKEMSNGWFLHLVGSHEAIFLGLAKPDFEAGDIVTLTIKKEPKEL